MPVGAGAAVLAVGAIAGGIAQSNMSNYQAKVAQLNQQIADQNATYAEQAGQVQAFNTALRNRGVGGRLKANQAASGIDVNTGSAAAVQASERETGLQDVQQTVANANRQAYGYRSQGVGFQAQATADRTAATNEIVGSLFSAAGDVAGGSGTGGGSPSWSWGSTNAAPSGADMGTTWPGFEEG